MLSLFGSPKDRVSSSPDGAFEPSPTHIGQGSFFACLFYFYFKYQRVLQYTDDMLSLTEIKNTATFSAIARHWLTIAFLLGFTTDVLLLNQVDDAFDNAVLLIYISLATASLVLFYVGIAEKVSPRLRAFFLSYMPAVMQYAFGGLLSGMLIFYGRSGDFLVSAPFLLLIVAVMVGNELVKKRSDRLLYNLMVYFIGIFSYLVLIVPVLLGEMGTLVFIGSGLLALLLMYGLIQLLSKIIPHFLVLEKRMIIFSIGTVYMIFNGFYFFNIIPPIPLSLTELSIHQLVERTTAGGYRMMTEEVGWFSHVGILPTTFHPSAGDGAYCFARVYAPTSLKTDIVHRWEYQDAQGTWQEHYVQSYPITWENKNGYRGFTTVKSIRDGLWRCSVETTRGQVLGRETFRIDTSRAAQDLVTVVE
jgi:hypothetical protein